MAIKVRVINRRDESPPPLSTPPGVLPSHTDRFQHAEKGVEGKKKNAFPPSIILPCRSRRCFFLFSLSESHRAKPKKPSPSHLSLSLCSTHTQIRDDYQAVRNMAPPEVSAARDSERAAAAGMASTSSAVGGSSARGGGGAPAAGLGLGLGGAGGAPIPGLEAGKAAKKDKESDFSSSSTPSTRRTPRRSWRLVRRRSRAPL